MYTDLVGQKFGRLKPIKVVGKANSHGVLWLCQCDCGRGKVVRSGYLAKGTTSCGCYRRELSVDQAKKMGEGNVKHGKSRRTDTHPLFYVWCGMRGRCKYPSHISYKTYGAKGIRVCEEWEDFPTFYEWAIANGWEKGLAIDRIDPNGDYCPENCQFIAQAENNRRQKRTIWIEHNGERKTIPQWAEVTGIKHATIRYRYNKGLPVEEILAV